MMAGRCREFVVVQASASFRQDLTKTPCRDTAEPLLDNGALISCWQVGSVVNRRLVLPPPTTLSSDTSSGWKYNHRMNDDITTQGIKPKLSNIRFNGIGMNGHLIQEASQIHQGIDPTVSVARTNFAVPDYPPDFGMPGALDPKSPLGSVGWMKGNRGRASDDDQVIGDTKQGCRNAQPSPFCPKRYTPTKAPKRLVSPGSAHGR